MTITPAIVLAICLIFNKGDIMRKITKESATALLNREHYKNSNTQVTGGHLTLHGYEIVELANNALYLDTCGWLTVTTKERLNGVLTVFNTGLQIVQRNFEWFVMDMSNRKLTPFYNQMKINLN